MLLFDENSSKEDNNSYYMLLNPNLSKRIFKQDEVLL